MSPNEVSVVVVHGARAHGASRIITPLAGGGPRASAPSLPPTSFSDEVAAIDRGLELDLLREAIPTRGL